MDVSKRLQVGAQARSSSICVPAHNTVVSPGRKGRCPGLENGNGKSGSENSEKAR